MNQINKETQEKKKKKKRVIDCDSNTSSSMSSFSEDLVREILSRLPVKSLMRFKCVSKYWKFLIEFDTSFIYQHFERSKARPCLHIANLIDNEKTYQFTTADLSFGMKGEVSAATFHTVRNFDFTDCDLMVMPVNGLTVFYGETRIDPGVYIANLCTRQVTPWIGSKLLRDLREKDLEAPKTFSMATCAFGYDPTSKEHKVVGIWRSLRPAYEVCEVLTVGDNQWRQIDALPPHSIELDGSNICINGSIYYTTESLMVSESGDEDKAKFIVAFDVGREKFRAIRVPSHIFERPYSDQQPYSDDSDSNSDSDEQPESDDGDEQPYSDDSESDDSDSDDSEIYFYNIGLLELDGRLGLLIILENRGYRPPKFWVLDEDKKKKSSWTEVTMQLPYSLGGGRYGFTSNPVSGTQQIILTSYVETSDGKISDSTCHSHSLKNKTFNEVEFSGISSSIPCLSSTSRVATFFESLLPVQKPFTRSAHQG